MPITRGDPKNPEFIYRKLCILTFLNISHLQNTLPLMHYMYRDFFPLLKAVFELIDFDAFQCFHCFFCFTSILVKCFPFRSFFNQGNKKSHSG